MTPDYARYYLNFMAFAKNAPVEEVSDVDAAFVAAFTTYLTLKSFRTWTNKESYSIVLQPPLEEYFNVHCC